MLDSCLVGGFLVWLKGNMGICIIYRKNDMNTKEPKIADIHYFNIVE